MGRHGGRPSLNFGAFLAAKNVHAAPKKGAPLLDTRPSSRCPKNLALVST